MCGIIHIKRFDGRPAKKMLNKRYQVQKERGKEGFGYLAIDDDYLVDFKRTMTEKAIMDAIDKVSANEILFHHRFPTSTPNLAECAHPIVINHAENKYIYFVIHNGVIWNDKSLKAGHEKLGYQYTTQIENITSCAGKEISKEIQWNDSEALAIELARDLDKDQKGIKDVYGSIAFIAIQAERETQKAIKLFFGRNFQSPLNIDLVEGQYLAITSIGKGELVPAHILHSYDYATEQIEKKAYEVGTSSYTTGNGYYDRYDRADEVDGFRYRETKQIGFSNVARRPEDTTFGDDAKDQIDESITRIENDLKDDKYYGDLVDSYWQLKEEQADIIDILGNWVPNQSGSQADRSWYEEELIRITEELKIYDDKTPVINAS